jgi:uncharacterized repeat protein (TIGR04076 family)
MKILRICIFIVEITVKNQKGKCAFGHKVGERILFDGMAVKEDLCYSALTVLLPKVLCDEVRCEFSVDSRQGHNLERLSR